MSQIGPEKRTAQILYHQTNIVPPPLSSGSESSYKFSSGSGPTYKIPFPSRPELACKYTSGYGPRLA